MTISITDMIVVEHEAKPGEFGVKLVFKCRDCNHTWSVVKYETSELDIIVGGLKKGIATSDSACPKCVPMLDSINPN